jgi:hypothetical protein
VGSRTGTRSERAARWARWAFVALRVVVTVHTLVVFAQPTTAGRYLDGDYDSLEHHALGADVLSSLSAFQLLLAVALASLGGVRWPLAGAAVLIAAETAVYLTGEEGGVAVHIPLGVVVVVGSVLLFLAVWRIGTGQASDRAADRTTDRTAAERLAADE